MTENKVESATKYTKINAESVGVSENKNCCNGVIIYTLHCYDTIYYVAIRYDMQCEQSKNDN